MPPCMVYALLGIEPIATASCLLGKHCRHISSPGARCVPAVLCIISVARGRNPSPPSSSGVPGTATPPVLEGLPARAACKLSLIHRVLSAREPDKRCYYDHPSPTEKKLRQLWVRGCGRVSNGRAGGCSEGADPDWAPSAVP